MNLEDIEFTKIEHQILKKIINANGIITRDEIYQEIWGSTYLNYRTLDVYVKRIRDKIEDKDKTKIKTIRGYGYKWTSTK